MKIFVACSSLLVALAAGSVQGQAFNIDSGSLFSTTVSASYEAASGQSGTWNARQLGFGLFDVNGVSTGATHLGAGGVNRFSYPFLNGDEREMMESVEEFNSTTFAVFSGLQPGLYDMYVYMWWERGNNFSQQCEIYNGVSYTSISVEYGNGQWPGQQTLGVTYNVARVEVLSTGFLSFQVFKGGPGDLAVVNGLQLVPVPAPGGLALLPALALAAARRRRV